LKRLLVVDDDPDICEFIQTVAKDAGFAAESASNPERFLAVYRHGAFDLIVLDLVMPEKSGTEILQILAHDGCQAGIVLVSGADLQVLSAAERFAAFHGLKVLGTLQKPMLSREIKRLFEEAR